MARARAHRQAEERIALRYPSSEADDIYSRPKRYESSYAIYLNALTLTVIVVTVQMIDWQQLS